VSLWGVSVVKTEIVWHVGGRVGIVRLIERLAIHDGSIKGEGYRSTN
jgi:hypothetical protein